MRLAITLELLLQYCNIAFAIEKFNISTFRAMFTAASMTYQRQRKREKEAARRALAKMEVTCIALQLHCIELQLTTGQLLTCIATDN